MNVVQEANVKTPTIEYIHRQALLLLMAAKKFSAFIYPTAVENCQTWDEKFYIRRENHRITDFLTDVNLWLSEKPLQSERSGNGHSESNSEQLGDLPFYHPERTDLDHLLPSEFIGIRTQVERFSNILNCVPNMSA